MTLGELKASPGESTEAVAARVLAGREIQQRRLGESVEIPVNAAMADAQLRRHCRLEDGAQRLLDTAFDKLGLSARALTRILKVARTIADLAGHDRIGPAQVAEAIQYRSLDRRLTP